MKPSVIYKEVKPPDGYWCDSGHVASKTFRRNGPGTEEEPTKFFKVSGPNIPGGIFCEPCLIIANHLAKKKKEFKDGSK
jgi:hypothetical protein